jgi:nucleotide-binding universal stress UspA family protein
MSEDSFPPEFDFAAAYERPREGVLERAETPSASQACHSASTYLSRIAVLVDHSPESVAALQNALALAREHNSRLTLLTVVAGRASVETAGFPVPAGFTDPFVADGQEVLRRFVDGLPHNLSCTTVLRVGDVVSEVRKYLNSDPQDVLFVGLGRTGILRIHTGWVVWRLTRRTPGGVRIISQSRHHGESR